MAESAVIHGAQFFRILSTDYIRLYEGTIEMLTVLKEKGKKLYLLSNAQRIYTEYEMNALGITDFFDDIFLSSDFACRKPDIRFFRELMRRKRISASSAVMIGNDGVCDIEGARAVGLASVYIRSNLSPERENPAADYVLDCVDMKTLQRILLS